MADELEQLSKRVTKLEKTKSLAELIIGSLLSPLLTALIGALALVYVTQVKNASEAAIKDQERTIQSALDKTTKSIERLELAQKMIPDLFSDNPDRAFATERILEQVVEPQLAAEIQAMVEKFFGKKLGDALASGNDQEAAAIVTSADSVGSAAASKVVSSAKQAHPQQLAQVRQYQLASVQEKAGFQALAAGDFGAAHSAFETAHKAYPRYHNVSEISALLAKHGNAPDADARRALTETLIKQYAWGAPPGAIEQLRQRTAAQ
jgi:hypothetical protein